MFHLLVWSIVLLIQNPIPAYYKVVEKIKSIYIPKLTIGEEKILLPALHLPEFESLSIVVGSSAQDWAAKFNNPHLLITAGDCGLTS